MNRRPDYRLHERFIAPAKLEPALWRFLLGLVLAIFAYVVFNQTYFAGIYTLAGGWTEALGAAIDNGTTPFAMYALLISFGCMILAIALPAQILQRRGVLSLLGPLDLLWADFKRVSVMMLLLGLVLTALPPYDMGGEMIPNTPVGLWVLMLPFSLLAVLIQVSAEEIVFRGYIQQQLAARFRSPLVWMVLPALLFAWGHYMPEDMGENAGLIALWACVFGMLMADLTARSGSLGPAIAVHFWNNVTAILIVSVPDSLYGLALYLSPISMQNTEAMRAWLPVEFALMIVTWLAARLAIRR